MLEAQVAADDYRELILRVLHPALHLNRSLYIPTLSCLYRGDKSPALYWWAERNLLSSAESRTLRGNVSGVVDVAGPQQMTSAPLTSAGNMNPPLMNGCLSVSGVGLR